MSTDPAAIRRTGKQIKGAGGELESASPITVIDPDERNRTAYHLVRRLNLAFNDLGLLSHLPDHFVKPITDGVAFCALTTKQADRLVLLFETLAIRDRSRKTRTFRGQLKLF